MSEHQNKKVRYDDQDLNNENENQLLHKSSQIDILAQLQSVPQITNELLKIEKINQMLIHIKQIEEKNSFSDINEDLCREFKLQIGNGKTGVEKALFLVVHSISQVGINIISHYDENKFFLIFSDSGLLQKIELIFQQNFEQYQNEQNNDDFSDYTLEVAQTYAFINKHRNISQKNCIICGNILQSNITNLILKMKDSSNQLNENEMNLIQNNQMLSDEIKKGIKSLKSIQGIAQSRKNCQILEDKLNIFESISPLIHINCQFSPQLHCNQFLIIPDNIIVQQLQCAVFGSLSEFIWDNNTVKQYLLNTHNIFNHIIIIIISFAQQYQQNRISLSKQFLSQSSIQTSQFLSQSHHSLIDGTLNLFLSLLYNNITLYQQASHFPNLIQSMIQLTGFNRKKDGQLRNQIQSAEIRMNSSDCLQCFLDFGCERVIKSMINELNFVGSQIDGIANGGGALEEDNDVICLNLQNIQQLFHNLNHETKFHPPLEGILFDIKEQVDEFGGNEEINANQFHSKELQNERLTRIANITYMLFINVKKDLTNERQIQ